MTATLTTPVASRPVPEHTELQPLECRALALFEEISVLSLKQIAVALEISPQYARLLMHGLKSLGYAVRKLCVRHEARPGGAGGGHVRAVCPFARDAFQPAQS